MGPPVLLLLLVALVALAIHQREALAARWRELPFASGKAAEAEPAQPAGPGPAPEYMVEFRRRVREQEAERQTTSVAPPGFSAGR